MLPQNWLNKVSSFGVDIAWMHWNRLGVRGSGKPLQCSVDPEALLILTSLVAEREIRLWEAMAAWLSQYESLIPIDRLKKLTRIQGIPPQLVTFLRMAVGKQQLRWHPILIQGVGAPVSDQTLSISFKESLLKNRLQTHEWIIQKNPLLELRYLFGPSIRADVLYYTLVLSSQAHARNEMMLTTSALRLALFYDPSAIYRTLQNLLHAGVLAELPLPEQDEKNKFYCLSSNNRFFGKYARHAPKSKEELRTLPDLHYIRWIPLVEMVRAIEIFLASLQALSKTNPTNPEALLKSFLSGLLNDISENALNAWIPIQRESFSAHALRGIPIEKMMETIESRLSEILGFLSKR